MDAYRTAGFRCPLCPESPLREFHNRMVCDECEGMLLDGADLAKACSDLVNKDITLAFGEGTPTTSSCPKCERAMVRCHVAFTPLAVKADVLRCDRDGLWFERGLLAGVFALLGRKAHGVVGYPHYTNPSATGLDGLPVSRHAPASRGLRISEWRNRPRRRDKTLTPINAYRDQHLACPVCANAELVFFGDRYDCAECAGTFVQNAAFEAMVMDVAHELFQLPPTTGVAGPRACPVCEKPMLVEEVDRVPIDRCGHHGIWFDANELAVALERASGQFDHGWRAWLKRLLPR